MRWLIGLVACASLAGCTQAHIRLPAALAAAAAPVPITGIGGKPAGSFRAGEYGGAFSRRLDRVSFTDGAVDRFGSTTFDIAGPEISSTIEANCAMREHAVDLGLAEVTVRPLAYRCSFTAEGRAMAARFELQEVVGTGTAVTRYERRGEIALGGETVQFRSLHHTAGTSLPSLTPVGYVFEHAGRPIGALELTGRATLTSEPGLAPGARRTMTVAALALALFWDPAIHGLD